MFDEAVSQLCTYVPNASRRDACATLISLLCRYTSGLSLAIAADELTKVRKPRAEPVYRGKIIKTESSPLHIWYIAGEPCVVAHVHSHFVAGLAPTLTQIRIPSAHLTSLLNSPPSIVSAAKDTFGDRKCKLSLPTEVIAFERTSIPHHCFTLQRVWDERQLAPNFINASIVEVQNGPDAHLRLADEASLSQPSVLFKLGEELRELTTLLVPGEEIVLERPVVCPTGASFELFYGSHTVVSVVADPESLRSRKRARTATLHTDDCVFLADIQRIPGLQVGAKASGLATVEVATDDASGETKLQCVGGVRIAMTATGVQLHPGYLIWFKAATWDGQGWTSTHSINLSELVGVLHAPFVRDIVPLSALTGQAMVERAPCTVQLRLQIIGISTPHNDNSISLRVISDPTHKQNADQDQNTKEPENPEVNLEAPDHVVQRLWYRSSQDVAACLGDADRVKSLLEEVDCTILSSAAISFPQGASGPPRCILCAVTRMPNFRNG